MAAHPWQPLPSGTSPHPHNPPHPQLHTLSGQLMLRPLLPIRITPLTPPPPAIGPQQHTSQNRPNSVKKSMGSTPQQLPLSPSTQPLGMGNPPQPRHIPLSTQTYPRHNITPRNPPQQSFIQPVWVHQGRASIRPQWWATRPALWRLRRRWLRQPNHAFLRLNSNQSRHHKVIIPTGGSLKMKKRTKILAFDAFFGFF